jgi:hypothetical protein
MAHQALSPGRTTVRRRALFGLLDADGWSWAGVKAFFWFIVIIFMLGYIPDRAYYFTVFPQIDIGVLAWSPINFCPPENKNLPCPAPVGSVRPWELSPGEVALPGPRLDGVAVQAGTKFLYIGGTDGTAPTDEVLVAQTSGTGNFDRWTQGPPLPEPRTNVAAAFLGGSVYVAGGEDGAGAPADTVFILTPNTETGELGEWQTAEDAELPLTLPEGRSGASLVAAADGLILVGGRTEAGPTASILKSTLGQNGAPGEWAPQADLFVAVSDTTAVLNGDFVWVLGGSDANGPTAAVQRADVGTGEQAGQITRVAVADEVNLPGPRSDAAGFAANGNLYVVGGSDGSTAHRELYWAVPDSGGNFAEWKHLPESDLPEQGLVGSAPLVGGSNAFLIGGRTNDGPTASSARANLAPREPFFQLGLVGVVVPALKIEGEIGQQLGYLNAAGAGTVNFVILLLIGWMYAHKERTREIFEGVRRRRRRH